MLTNAAAYSKVSIVSSETDKNTCASGSGVEYNLAKVGVAGSNPVSRLSGYRKISVFFCAAINRLCIRMQ